MQKDFPNEKLIGFFYDPNIHPYSEYQLRYLDVERSCKKLGIELLQGEYDFKNWIDAVKGLEKEPEKGKRCEVCFDKRFRISAQKALELGEKKITTTLLVSPLKSQEQLKSIGYEFYKKHGVEFIAVDYRSHSGTQDQSRITKEEQLYRQDYCGCIYGLTMQREAQGKLLDELFSPISDIILPASIEHRLQLYKKRISLEDKNIAYKIIKYKFLNYRQFTCKLVQNKNINIPSYALVYSTLPRKKAQGKIEFEIDDIYYFNKNEIKFITLDTFNKLTCKAFSSIKELIFNPLSFEDEVNLRYKIIDNLYDLTPIIVIDNIIHNKLTLYLDATIYEDVQEKIIKI